MGGRITNWRVVAYGDRIGLGPYSWTTVYDSNGNLTGSPEFNPADPSNVEVIVRIDDEQGEAHYMRIVRTVGFEPYPDSIEEEIRDAIKGGTPPLRGVLMPELG